MITTEKIWGAVVSLAILVFIVKFVQAWINDKGPR